MSLYTGLKSKDIGAKSQHLPAQLAALTADRQDHHCFACEKQFDSPWHIFVLLTNLRIEAMKLFHYNT